MLPLLSPVLQVCASMTDCKPNELQHTARLLSIRHSTSVARSIQQRQLWSLKRPCHTDIAASAALLTPPTARSGFWTRGPAGGSAAGGCVASVAAVCCARRRCSSWPPVPRSCLPLRGCCSWLLGCAAPFGCLLWRDLRLGGRLRWRCDRLSPAGIFYDAPLWIVSTCSRQIGSTI